MPHYVTIVRLDGMSSTISGLTYEQANELFTMYVNAGTVRYAEWGEIASEPLNRFCDGAHF